MPKQVVEEAKICILDYMGVTIGGSTADESRIVSGLVRELGEKQEATILGYGGKASSTLCALANGTSSHTLELDDHHRTTSSHPSGPVISATFSLAERGRTTGRDLILAVVLGYEVLLRLGDAVNYSASLFNRGFRPTGTCGSIAAAAASAKILGLSCEGIAKAMGLGGVQASGIWDWTMAKRFVHGKAAESGVMAALLSQRGFDGSTKVLEAKRGFCSAFSDEFDIERITKDLGTGFKIMEVTHKLYSSTRIFHAALEATKEILRVNSINPSDIERIVARDGAPSGDSYLNEYNAYKPENMTRASLSLPFCIAIMVYEGRVTPDVFTEKNLKDPKILELGRKVERIHDPELSRLWPMKRAGIAEVTTKDGRSYSLRVDYPKGDPENPATKKELEDKFRAVTSTVLSDRKVDQLINVLGNLDHLDDVSKISPIATP